METLQLIGSFLVCGSAGAIGAIWTARSVKTWYPTLRKPSFNPPSRVFGPAWTLLYLLMGISLYLVWSSPDRSGTRLTGLVLFFVQLLFNAAWSVIFFGLRRLFYAFLEISLLWALISGTIVCFWQVSPTAGSFLVPYLLWVGFAAALNYAIWKLNSPPR